MILERLFDAGGVSASLAPSGPEWSHVPSSSPYGTYCAIRPSKTHENVKENWCIQSCTSVADSQSQGLAEQAANMSLNPDVPLTSVEGGLTDSSGGINISRASTYSRTPSLSLSPAADDFEPQGTPHNVGSRRRLTSGTANDTIDHLLGMSEVAAALEGVVRGSDNQDVLLLPERPAASSTSSSRRASGRRSSLRTDMTTHDVANEELPNDSFHEPVFQQAFTDARRFMSRLTEVLASNSLHNEPDSTMSRLHKKAVKLAGFQCPSTRTVGFVGDSGVGK